MKISFSVEAKKFIRARGGVCTIVPELFSGSC